MDGLKYEYYDKSNKLKKVTDSQYNFPEGDDFSDYQDGANGVSEEFTYDPLGNLLTNHDKELAFQYNDLGLAQKISKSGETDNLQYVYDATGAKLRKQVGDKTWYYVNGIEYFDDGVNGMKLLQVSTEIGCARPTPEDADNESLFVYDISILDHLGNVRVIITNENAHVVDMATIEPQYVLAESEIFDGVLGPNSTTPSTWPTTTTVNTAVTKLHAGGYTIGPSKLLKVKASDKLSVDVESFYDEPEENSYPTAQTLAQILGSMLLNIGAQGQDVLPPGESGIGVFANGASAQSTALANFIWDHETELYTGKPDAYLIYIIFDKDLNIDTDKSGVVPVGDEEQLTLLQSDLQTMSADGYFYTYVTNLAQTKVYYNNFTVHHMRGNIRQINDYYPYGLTWSRPEGDDACMYQNKQWQQNEWGEGRGLEMYDFHVQMLLAAVQRRLRDSHPAAQPCGTKMGVYPDEGRNPVIAHWHAPDPMNQFDSPYIAMLRSSWSKQSGDLEIRIPQQCFAGGNNPVVNIDPDGMQVPWAGILSSLSRIQITETVKHCTNAARMTFENITISKNLFGQLAGVMDIAGGLLAFGEGALILSEEQKDSIQKLMILVHQYFQEQPQFNRDLKCIKSIGLLQ